MSLYAKRELVKKSAFQKLLKKEPEENFLIELENLFSDYENSLDSLTKGRTNEIFEKYSISSSSSKFLAERTELLRRYIKKCLEKFQITDEEMRIIKRLGELLFLSENVISTEIDDLASPVFSSRIESFLQDGIMSDQEKNQLSALSNELRLSDSAAKQIYLSAVKSRMDDFTKPVFESELYSPEDERKMHEAAKRLGINLKFPEDTQTKLSKYRRNWELVNGNLPVLQSDILLQKNEVLHLRLSIDWMEERSVTKRVNYSGFSFSTKIIGNLRWKTGTVCPQRITSQELKKIDSGTLYLTNKRFIFTGGSGNKTILLTKILGFTPYADGMLVEKETGRSPFFACECDMREFSIILERLLSNR